MEGEGWGWGGGRDEGVGVRRKVGGRGQEWLERVV